MSEPRGPVNLLHIIEAYTKSLTAVRGVIDLLKNAANQLPQGEQKSSVEGKVKEAERALGLANAEMGHALGYQLCQCSWPPQIMVTIGAAEKGKEEQVKCPNCGKVVSRAKAPGPDKEATAFDPYDVY